jgi:hypothetical protein
LRALGRLEAKRNPAVPLSVADAPTPHRWLLFKNPIWADSIKRKQLIGKPRLHWDL